MLGTIAGDIIGRPFEMCNYKGTNFPLFSNFSNFTDDSVLTIATAYKLMNLNKYSYSEVYRTFTRKYPTAGYGHTFRDWAFAGNDEDPPQPPYNSWSNGAGMRVSPIGYFFDNLEDVLNEAKKSAEVTHDHEEGILGAKAASGATHIALKTKDKNKIKEFIVDEIGYDLDLDYNNLVETYTHEYHCRKSIPHAVYTFLISENFEDSIRKAISIGGDSDTIAAINGGIAEAYYGKVPEKILNSVVKFFDGKENEHLKKVILKFVNEFTNYKYFKGNKNGK